MAGCFWQGPWGLGDCPLDWLVKRVSFQELFSLSSISIENVSKGSNDRPTVDVIIADSGEVIYPFVSLILTFNNILFSFLSNLLWMRMEKRYLFVLSFNAQFVPQLFRVWINQYIINRILRAVQPLIRKRLLSLRKLRNILLPFPVRYRLQLPHWRLAGLCLQRRQLLSLPPPWILLTFYSF